MICGVIDIGSNTVRLSVFKVHGKDVVSLFNVKEALGLVSYRKGRILLDEGVEKLIQVLAEFQKIINNFGDIEVTYAIATASLRDVKNREEILTRIRLELGLTVEIISGDEEARMAFLGASHFLPDHELGILADIGGGSTELVRFFNRDILDSVSLDLGSLTSFRYYVSQLFIAKSERAALEKDLLAKLRDSGISRKRSEYLCAVGGSARAGLVLYNDYYGEDIHNRIMSRDKLGKLLTAFINMEAREKFRRIIYLKADRLHTVLPGICILHGLAKYFKIDIISVSETGIREGFLRERLVEERQPEYSI